MSDDREERRRPAVLTHPNVSEAELLAPHGERLGLFGGPPMARRTSSACVVDATLQRHHPTARAQHSMRFGK
ncbi:MAG: hypothetical protein AB7R77_20650, partial [Ilumatobacteraceae bacterium]